MRPDELTVSNNGHVALGEHALEYVDSDGQVAGLETIVVICADQFVRGHDHGMRSFLRRSTVAAAAPIVAVSLFSAGIGSAEPLNCVNGQFWDPITNTCQTPRPAENCGLGEYWNALSNVCRPLGQL